MHPAGPDGAKQNNTRETPPATGESRDGRTFCVMLVPEKLGYVAPWWSGEGCLHYGGTVVARVFC